MIKNNNKTKTPSRRKLEKQKPQTTNYLFAA
jgi:hypothetical protein